jgi:WD40 repeat protein
VEVPPLSQAESMSILDACLQSAGRSLTELQYFEVGKAVKNHLMPLYVTLLAKHCSKWQSATFPNLEHVLNHSVEGLIVAFLKQLEVRHGHTLISHALALVTVAKEGLSESELEDILSCDEAVLGDVYQYWIPPLRRLPPMLWLRVQADLDDHLVKRGNRGAQLFAWYHQSFCFAVRKQYLQSDEDRVRAHSAISDYFLGLWASGKAKPYREKDGSVQLSDRAVEQQPFVFSEGTASLGKQYNYRKLMELPHNLCHSRRLSELKSEVLCNYKFLYTKLKAFSLSALLDDFRLAIATYPDDRELIMLQETLLISGACLDKRPSELAGQLIGRLTASVAKEDVYLQKLLTEALSPEKLCLIPTSACLTPPGCRLRKVMAGHKGEINCVAVSTNNTIGLSVADDHKLKQWDITSGVCLQTRTVLAASTPAIFVAFTDNDTSATVVNVEGIAEKWLLLTSRLLYQATTVKEAEHFAVSIGQEWLAVTNHKEVCLLETKTGNVMWKQVILKHPGDITITLDSVVIAVRGKCSGLLKLPLRNPKASDCHILSTKDNIMCIAGHDIADKLYMLSNKSKKVQHIDFDTGVTGELDFCSISHAEKLVITDSDKMFLALRRGQLMMLTKAGPTTVCVQHGYITTFACNNSSCIVTGSASSLVYVFDLVNYHQEIQLPSKEKLPVDYIRSGSNCDSFIALGTDELNPLRTGPRLTHLTVWHGTGDLVSQFSLKHRVKRFTVLSEHQVLLLCHRHLVVVNLVSGSVEHVIKGKTGRYLYDINVDKDSNLVVLSKGRRNLKIVDLVAEHAVEIIKIISDSEKRDRLSSVLVSGSGNMAVCCQENRSATLISQKDTGPIHVVDLISKELFTIPVHKEYNFIGSSISPSGQWLALAMQTHSREEQSYTSGFQLYNLTERIETAILSRGGVEPYTSTWSPCSQIFLTSWWDSTICLWCPVTGQQLAIFKQHEDVVAKLTVSRQMLVLSACESSVDHQICIWSLLDFSLVSSFTPDECPKQVAIADSGSFVSYQTVSQGMVTMSLISGNAKRQSTTGSRSVVKRSIEISFSVEEHHDPYDIDSDSDINDVL